MKKRELADLIDAFLDGTCGEWEWDDFTSVKQPDPELERVRQKCLTIPKSFPSEDPHIYCNTEGAEVLRSIARALRETGQSAGR